MLAFGLRGLDTSLTCFSITSYFSVCCSEIKHEEHPWIWSHIEMIWLHSLYCMFVTQGKSETWGISLYLASGEFLSIQTSFYSGGHDGCSTPYFSTQIQIDSSLHLQNTLLKTELGEKKCFHFSPHSTSVNPPIAGLPSIIQEAN